MTNKIAVVIPFRDRGIDPLRVANLERVLEHWRPYTKTALAIDDGREGDAQFNRSAAYNKGIRRRRVAEVFIFTESDMILDYGQIDKAVQMALEAPGLVVPFTQYRYLSPEDSERVRANEIAPEDCTPESTMDNGRSIGAVNVVSRETLNLIGQWDEGFCVDDQTEIFTMAGWKSYQDVGVGDMVLTLNHVTGLSEWKPVQAMNVYEGIHEVISIESKVHSSLTTPNHRWPVVRGQRKTMASGEVKEYAWRNWKTTDTLTTQDYVPIAAECADLPDIPKYADALVECVAWFWTEGSISRLRDGSSGRNVSISQSIAVNPDKVERIASALTLALGPESESFPRRSGGRGQKWPVDIPRWYMRTKGRNAIFYLNAEAGEIMQELAPGRVPTSEFLLSLTKAQLLLFIDRSLDADGTRRRNGKECSLGQKNPAAVDALQFACILAGVPTSVSTNPTMPKYGYGQTVLNLRKTSRIRISHSSITPGKRVLAGVVWCPTTENGTWLARRNGKVYFTGNSGNWYDDNAMQRAFEVCAGPTRWVDGPAHHLYHLPGWKGSHLTDEDKAATARNKARYGLYQRAETPERIRELTSGLT